MLTPTQLKGLSVKHQSQQNPYIWNPNIHQLFDQAHPNDIQFQKCTQTFNSFKTQHADRFENFNKMKIRLVHILKEGGKIPTEKFMDKYCSIISKYFGLEVEIDPRPFGLSQDLKFVDQDGKYQYQIPLYKNQLKAVTLLHVLIPYKQPNELLLTLINSGICQGTYQISGRAIGNGVVVIDSRQSIRPTEIISTTIHQLMHTFGIGHCTYWRCIMNPLTNNQILMCPVCLKKYHHFIKFDIEERYQEMMEVLKKEKLIASSRRYREVLDVFEKYCQKE